MWPDTFVSIELQLTLRFGPKTENLVIFGSSEVLTKLLTTSELLPGFALLTTSERLPVKKFFEPTTQLRVKKPTQKFQLQKTTLKPILAPNPTKMQSKS